jgi:predicted RNase H-like nuclease
VPVTTPRRRPRSQIVPKGKTEWLAYISEFVEEAKASSFDQKTIVSARAGSRSPHRAIHNERIRGWAIVRCGSKPVML